MIALDTNVLVRLLTADDPEQTAAATRLVERAVRDSARLEVSTIVLCETVWVLKTGYEFPKSRIVAAVSEMLETLHLRVEQDADVRRALAAFASGRGDFADYLIRERALAAGAAAVATFDGPLLAETGFIHPDPDRWSGDVAFHERPPEYGSRRPRRRSAR